MVFNAEGQVFLARSAARRRPMKRGAWEFPGGKVDWGETLVAAIPAASSRKNTA